jgi:CRISPR-associated exonuclease Cas4
LREEDFIQISGLQHLAFCKRQWALIHIDQEWEENFLTAEGRNLHERVDEGYQEFRKGLRQYSGLYVKSLKLGIYGRTDLIEAIKSDNCPTNSIQMLGLKGKWTLFPVEFKRGKPKNHEADMIQLCAQALCLEEMTNTPIESGAIFYWQIRKRIEVEFDSCLRQKTIQIIELAHDLMELGQIPAAEYGNHCRSCSLLEICLPRKLDSAKLKKYRQELLG